MNVYSVHQTHDDDENEIKNSVDTDTRLLSPADQPNFLDLSRIYGLAEQPPYFIKTSAAEKMAAKPELVNNFTWKSDLNSLWWLPN